MEYMALAMTCILVLALSFLFFLYTPNGKKMQEM